MKRLSILLLLLLSASVGRAQDVIVMKNGDLVESQVLEITPTEIKYKKHSNPKGPTYTIAKSTVLAINYKNGEKEIIEVVEETFAPEEAPNTELGLPDDAANQQIISDLNRGRIWYSGKEKGKQKKADGFKCQLYAAQGSVFANKDLTLSIHLYGGGKAEEVAVMDKAGLFGDEDFSNFGVKLYVNVKNNTDRTIYIDLANTFLRRLSESYSLYTPESTSTTTGTSKGTSVNLGAFTGGLLSGVSVGSGSSKSSTTVTYAQRVVAIPPQSSRDLAPQFIFPREEGPAPYDGFEVGYRYILVKMQGKRSQEFEWKEEDSPLRCGMFITYSPSEDFAYKANMKFELYLAKAVGGGGVMGVIRDLSTDSALTFEALSGKD